MMYYIRFISQTAFLFMYLFVLVNHLEHSNGKLYMISQISDQVINFHQPENVRESWIYVVCGMKNIF
jgi:hypothetical protein